MADRLDLPLLVYEILSASEPFANDRRHIFVLEGVRETAKRLRELGIGYVFDLRREKAAGDRLPREAVRDAAAVVTDDYPALLQGRDESFDAAAWAVDSSCVVPAALIGQRAYAAYSIRPHIHELLPRFLKPAPAIAVRNRFAGPLPPLPEGTAAELAAACEIDHSPGSSTAFRGGRAEALRHLDRFLADRLRRYAREKNEPAAHATSELSPYLHFGYISALEVALAVRERAREDRLIADEFLEELIVRRELAFNFVRFARALDTLDELPEWAHATLRKHRGDVRDPLYSPEEFEAAQTGDELWNAAQKELLLRGKIHGYYRMYWGKKIIEWSKTPEEALATMLRLHDRYALDGRDPNTYANILWCFGLHDRPWAERAIFGTVRWMSKAGMDRKTDASAYIREIGELERTGKETDTDT